MIQLRYGSTRFVILAGPYAIKIARFRVLRLIAWLLFSLVSNRQRTRFKRRYGDTIKRASYQYLFVGIEANMMEYTYSTRHPQDQRIIPTLRCLLKGLVTLQPRGQSVTVQEFQKRKPLAAIAGFREADKPRQFCSYQGRLVLADYGDANTCIFLGNTF